MDDLETLIARATRVYEDCGGVTAARAGAEQREEEERELKQDPFSVLRRATHRKVVECNEHIRLRNEAVAGDPTCAAIPLKNNHIRQCISAVEANLAEMQALHDRAYAKARPRDRTAAWEEAAAQRAEVLELVGRHVAELRARAARQAPAAAAAAHQQQSAARLFAGALGNSSVDESESDAVVVGGGARAAAAAELPAIDDLDVGIALIRRQEVDIDAQLDTLEGHVRTVKGQALAFRDELATQETILGDTRDLMEDVDAEVTAQTRQINDLVARMGGTNRNVTRIVLVVLLLIFVGVGVQLAL